MSPIDLTACLFVIDDFPKIVKKHSWWVIMESSFLYCSCLDLWFKLKMKASASGSCSYVLLLRRFTEVYPPKTYERLVLISMIVGPFLSHKKWNFEALNPFLVPLKSSLTFGLKPSQLENNNSCCLFLTSTESQEDGSSLDASGINLQFERRSNCLIVLLNWDEGSLANYSLANEEFIINRSFNECDSSNFSVI